ncbi:glycosyltransferase involved in cell wall biosynthesis [Pontibacter aydingkolensis]|uniref:Glycosyltransferase family 4 protein n=1 Tax=Pontibacter aydingkolensis TaxID=1911536 RepID=A0ABS7CZC7_9BACT|nr:glycosyltransferase family 4 protein [Pontibacter aydingkolensis]MBW7469036.1 glycosyltransferase family 4 protein [Pontibacter aydingkolensis]
MKVVHVNTSDTQGGAARAASRLHQALLEVNVDSLMLVQTKSGDDFTIQGPQTNLQKAAAVLRPFLDRLPTRKYNASASLPFSPSWVPFSGVAERINALGPDIVHLHWIANGMMSIEEIAQIKAPIVWSLHDSWAFTGGCHVRFDCEKYIQGCGACPVLGSDRQNDLSKAIFDRKSRTYSKIKNLTVTGPSRWLSKCASESLLFKNRKVVTLPIPLDTDTFSPVEKGNARRILNLPSDRKLVLFGAKNGTEDVNKGFKQLIEALDKIENNNVELLIFGSSKPKNPTDFKFKANYIGSLHDNVSLKLLYSAADVMVVPSIQEAFGQTASESLSCGTPVVAFGATGLLDIVDHQSNGYLAANYNTNDLAKGIDWVLSHPDYSELSFNARQKVLKSFDSKIIVHDYIRLYNDIISESIQRA